MSLDDPGDSEPRLAPEAGDGRQLADLGPGGANDGQCNGMLGGGLDGACEPQDLPAACAVERRDSGQLHPALGDGAGLVEDDRVDPPGLLEDLRPLDQHAELRAASGADHERRRRGEAERTRAGDDQDRDGGGEGGARARSERKPTAERGERDDDHDRDEDRGDTIGQALHRRLARLGLLDEARDLRQRGVGPDLRSTNDEPAIGVDGRAGNLAAGGDLDRNGFSRQHRPVDRRLALDDDAVRGDLPPRAHDEQVADLQRGCRHAHLLAIAQNVRLAGAELEQPADRLGRAALRARLQVAAEQDQRRHHRRDLEVRVRSEAADQDDGRPEPGRQRPERDQRVHRRCEMARAPQRGSMEGEPGVEDDRRRQGERDPFPAREAERRDHREQRDRQRQGDREREPPGQGAERPVVVVLLLVLVNVRAVADGLDCRDEVGKRHGPIAPYGRLFRREVDRRVDAVEPVQPLLDPSRAGSAGDPFEIEPDLIHTPSGYQGGKLSG